MPDVVEARGFANELAEAEILASAHIAASRIQRYAIIALWEREENCRAVGKKTDAQGGAADPTPDIRLVEVAQTIVDQMVQQARNGIQTQQGKLVGLLIEILAKLNRPQQRQHQQQQEKKYQQSLVSFGRTECSRL